MDDTFFDTPIIDKHKIEWLNQLARLGAGFLLGCAVAGIAYLSHYRSKGFRTSLLAMLVLMTVLIALVTLVIGSNIARAFSLAGVLSIIRFRTVIDDTRDTAFVIAAVAMGLAAGAGLYVLALLTLPFILITTMAFRTQRNPRKVAETIHIRIKTPGDPDALLQPIFAKYVHQAQLTNMDKNGKGTYVDLIYAIRLTETGSLAELMEALRQQEAVQRVKVRAKKD